MITIYPADCTDFSNNGLGILQPIECTIHEIAGGAYDLIMTHPIDSSNRWTLITNGCFIKAPAPVRESPLYEEDATGTTEETVTRSIYSVNTSGMRLNLRQGPSMDARIIGSYKPGTEVAKLGESGAWYQVSVCDGGAVGYMHGGNLQFVRDEQETITGNKPVTRQAVKVQPSRDQLFRVCSVEADSETGLMTVKALHVFYDLRGNLINGDYAPEGIPATQVVSYVASHLLNPSPITLHCYTTDPVTGDYGYKQTVEALLDPDEGILTKSNSLLIRDNFDAYLIPNQTRDMGVTIRRGKNLIGAVVKHDSTDIITRIIPVGKDKEGNDLFLDGTIYVDSPHINDYPTIYSVRKDYDVRVVDRDPDNVTTFISIADARAELYDLAMDEFDAGVDVPSYGIEVDFVLLSQAEGYEDYKDLQSIHMYDTVTVIDSMIGLNAKIKMTEYEWDCLALMYNSVKLADTQSVEQTVYSYNLPTGGVSGSKISTGSLSGNALRSASIDYAKINNAAITQLTADSVAAVRATIRELVAQQITTDQLYADLAAIAVAQITTANIDHANIQWAQIQNLAAEIASVASAEIGTAKIGHAQIYDLSADTALIEKGSAGNFFFDKLAVTSAQMVDLTVGQLTVKASNGNYYSLDVDIETGNVTANQVTVTQAEINAGKTSTGNHIIETDLTVGELNTSSAKATEALINKLTAQRIDVAELFAQQAFIAALDANAIKASNITALEGQLNVWANDKISLAIENLTNLLYNSSFWLGTENWTNENSSNTLVVGEFASSSTMPIKDSCKNYALWTINAAGRIYAGTTNVWESGKTFSVSFYAQTNHDVTIRLSRSRADYAQNITVSGSGWKRYSATINCTATVSGGTLSIDAVSPTAGTTLYIAGIMLQQGATVTAWTPSTQDTNTATDNLSTQLSLVDGKITAAVSNVSVGGTNLIRYSKEVKIGSDLWSLSTNVSTYADADLGYTIIWFNQSGATSNVWRQAWSPLINLGADWVDKQVTISGWVYSPNYAAIDQGSTVGICFGKDTRSSLNWVEWVLTQAGTNKWGQKVTSDVSAPINGKIHRFSMTFNLNTSDITSGTGTFADNTVMWVKLGIVRNADLRFYGLKAEWGNKATAWSPAPEDPSSGVVNNSITIDTEGIKMSSSDVFQLTATNSSKNSFIDIHGLLTANNTGGLMAQDGAFQNSLAVKGQRVLTKADISVPIVVSPNQPTGDDAHNLIWLQPSSVTGVRYTGYTADSRNSTVMFTSTNRTISRNFTAEASNTLANGTFTYTLEFEVISLADVQLTGVTFSASATKSSSTVSFSASSVITLTKYQTATITLTATSTTNLATNANAISVAITATASSYGGLYLNSKQNMPLTIAKSGGSGTQGCNVYYIP